jgi:dihydroorotate dehydrogenase electron transfer subunit
MCSEGLKEEYSCIWKLKDTGVLRKSLVYRIKNNLIRMIKILEIKHDSPISKMIRFRDPICSRARPGQYIMLWVPGENEMPMSLSGMDLNGEASITFKVVGTGTKKLSKMRPGDLLGVRGPYGNFFTINKGSALFVGGGTGLCPLLPLAERALELGCKVTLVAAAPSAGSILLMDRVELLSNRSGSKVLFITEDGSRGHKGLATDILPRLISQNHFDIIYTCGPEKMMKKIFNLAEKVGIPMEASLERLMKCSVGLCGLCTIGRYLVCLDGPVFNSTKLREVSGEFGLVKRDFTGRLVPQ